MLIEAAVHVGAPIVADAAQVKADAFWAVQALVALAHNGVLPTEIAANPALMPQQSWEAHLMLSTALDDHILQNAHVGAGACLEKKWASPKVGDAALQPIVDGSGRS